MTELGAAVAIQTARLILRSPLPEDAKVIARLANSPAVAKETFALPNPFSSDDARAWINGRDGHRFVVENRDSGQLFACKIILKRKLSTPSAVAAVRREIAIMRRLDHPSIVKLHGVYEDDRVSSFWSSFFPSGQDRPAPRRDL